MCIITALYIHQVKLVIEINYLKMLICVAWILSWVKLLKTIMLNMSILFDVVPESYVAVDSWSCWAWCYCFERSSMWWNYGSEGSHWDNMFQDTIAVANYETNLFCKIWYLSWAWHWSPHIWWSPEGTNSCYSISLVFVLLFHLIHDGT